MVIETSKVAAAHDAMGPEYDSIEDLWYSHLFNAIHEAVLDTIPQVATRGRALDVGCGTGFQSLLLARAGYEVTGFDVADQLLDLAKSKLDSEALPWPGYSTTLPGFMQEQEALVARADKIRGQLPFIPPLFAHGDATDSKWYPESTYDVITCCGSVLSFIDHHEDVLQLMSKALRPGGHLVIEVEQKISLDLVWPFIDWIMQGKLGYEQTIGESFENLFSKPGANAKIIYPFELENGEEVELPIWLFSIKYLRRIFKKTGLKVLLSQGVHAITNILPSTVLHRRLPGRSLIKLFTTLRSIEKVFWRTWPTRRLGCSVIFILQKPNDVILTN